MVATREIDRLKALFSDGALPEGKHFAELIDATHPESNGIYQRLETPLREWIELLLRERYEKPLIARIKKVESGSKAVGRFARIVKGGSISLPPDAGGGIQLSISYRSGSDETAATPVRSEDTIVLYPKEDDQRRAYFYPTRRYWMSGILVASLILSMVLTIITLVYLSPVEEGVFLPLPEDFILAGMVIATFPLLFTHLFQEFLTSVSRRFWRTIKIDLKVYDKTLEITTNVSEHGGYLAVGVVPLANAELPASVTGSAATEMDAE